MEETTHWLRKKTPALLRETFSRLDCTDILANDRFILGTGECDEGFFRDLKDAAMLKVKEINNIVFSPLHCVDEAYYDKARNEMVRQYLVIRPLVEVNLRTGMNLQQNTLENMKHMAGSPDVGELAGLFEEIPFVLVGAGPSLDESIDFLKFMQDKAIICASNSPFRKLVNSGIRPHLVVTADPSDQRSEALKMLILRVFRLHVLSVHTLRLLVVSPVAFFRGVHTIPLLIYSELPQAGHLVQKSWNRVLSLVAFLT